MSTPPQREQSAGLTIVHVGAPARMQSPEIASPRSSCIYRQPMRSRRHLSTAFIAVSLAACEETPPAARPQTTTVPSATAYPAPSGGSDAAWQLPNAPKTCREGADCDAFRCVASNSPDAQAPSQCLSECQVQLVIWMHQVEVRRQCWEKRDVVKPTISVSVLLTVDPEGGPQGVSTSGDDLLVAQCIEDQVRGWHFPAVGCTQKVGFAFKFVHSDRTVTSPPFHGFP